MIDVTDITTLQAFESDSATSELLASISSNGC
ncbi:hypothetical protein TSST111916_10285 [Tsukamurella strandjordii]